MFSTYYNVHTDVLTLHFDPSLPSAAAQHPEAALFLTRLREGMPEESEIVFQEGTQNIVGFSAPYAQLIDTFRQDLPSAQVALHEDMRRQLARVEMPQGEGLSVNFHQNPFDSDERYWQFTLQQKHFIPYIFNRIAWYMAPRYGLVTTFPLHVDLETASTCNMNCPMCYRDQLRHVGQMDFELFTRAVDECAAQGVFSLRLSWRGEALTHPRILDMVAYATAKIPNVSFLTNAFYLSDEVIDGLIAHRLSYVAVSFDGIGEIYEAIRHPAVFDESRDKLMRLHTRREAAKSVFPQVRLCTIWPAVRDNPDAYKNAMRPVCDYMVCNPYINFKGAMQIKPDFICQYPWERIVVAFDGSAQCCTGWEADDIVLGNVGEVSIAHMWHSEKMAHLRSQHRMGRRMDVPGCARCRHGSSGDPSADIHTIINRQF